jgi:hypothetical protein
MEGIVRKNSAILFNVLPNVNNCISIFFMPDKIPAHYDAQGEKTRWGSKYEAFISTVVLCYWIFFIGNAGYEENGKM